MIISFAAVKGSIFDWPSLGWTTPSRTACTGAMPSLCAHPVNHEPLADLC